MHRSRKLPVVFFALLLSAANVLPCLSLIDIADTLSGLGDWQIGNDEGVFSFRSLLIPSGGRAESLGSAYTGLSDDAGYMNFNAAGGCIQEETQISFFHNEWIADSKMETLSFTTRYGNFGIGAQAGCFYLPFSEYNALGEKVSASYYSETTALFNFSYNFLSGYDFKGLAIGGSIKSSWRSIPDYTDDDTGAIIRNSGLVQSGLAFMADVGLLLRFNFLKFYSSREPNVKIGIAAQNLGVSITGFSKKVTLDDPLPSYVAAGISIQFLPVISMTFDFKQPINLLDITSYQSFSAGTGIILDFSKFFNFLAGFELKGGNPKISVGAEFEVRKLRMNVNYTLDLTTSLSPLNRISLSARIMLGDKGRASVQKEIDRLYSLGLSHYYNSEWEEAIETWQEILVIDKHFDPAILGIMSAQSQIDMFDKVRGGMFLGD